MYIVKAKLNCIGQKISNYGGVSKVECIVLSCKVQATKFYLLPRESSLSHVLGQYCMTVFPWMWG